MKKFSAKSALLFATAMAACALAIPSAASASSWGVIGSEHTLDSPNLGYTSPMGGGVTSICGETSLTASVADAANLTVTSAAFRRCVASGPFVGTCTLTRFVTGFPWRLTATSLTNIQIHDIHIEDAWEDEPGFAGQCLVAGLVTTRVRTLRFGIHWTGNGAGQHEMLLDNAEGLTSTSALGNNISETWRGTLRDTQQTLTVT
jgi:hypothetical protein